MAGYHNYSMSNNAVAAYSRGCVPISKMTKLWFKHHKLDRIFGTVKKLKEAIKEDVVAPSEWHHTSKEYNCTDFYDPDVMIEEFVDGGAYSEIREFLKLDEKAYQRIRSLFLMDKCNEKCGYFTLMLRREQRRIAEKEKREAAMRRIGYDPDSIKKYNELQAEKRQQIEQTADEIMHQIRDKFGTCHINSIDEAWDLAQNLLVSKYKVDLPDENWRSLRVVSYRVIVFIRRALRRHLFPKNLTSVDGGGPYFEKIKYEHERKLRLEETRA